MGRTCSTQGDEIGVNNLNTNKGKENLLEKLLHLPVHYDDWESSRFLYTK
jgi:hypothetical protein